MTPSLYLGLLSGTSLDAVDTVIVKIDGDQTPEILHGLAHPIPGDLKARLKAAATDPQLTLNAAAELDQEVARLFANAALAILRHARLNAAQITAIGSHGQTLRHQPNGQYRYTVQIGDPNIIATRTGITVVSDFRRRDMSVGGQGAPLAPSLHRTLFSRMDENRAVLNLGGIANLTCLHKDRPVIGFDSGPANTLLDAWIEKQQHKPYDMEGQWAASGTAHKELLGNLLNDPFFRQSIPKSTGTDYFNMEWLQKHLAALSASPSAADVQATLAELTAQSIARHLRKHMPDCDRLLVCGGGAFNTDLMHRLRLHTGVPALSTEAYGIAPEWMEGLLFAWLAHRCLLGLPGNWPSVTGANREVILGAIYQ